MLARHFHRYGATADRIEKALEHIGERLGINLHIFSLPTGITVSFKFENEHEETRMERLNPGGINLGKLAEVDHVVDQVIIGFLTVEEGKKEINQIMLNKPVYNSTLATLSYAVISMTVVIFLRGTLWDALCSMVIGLFVGIFSETVKKERIDSIAEGVNVFLVTVMAGLCTTVLPVNAGVVTLSALIVLIPGLMLTMAIKELASQNLTSGTARLTGALMITLKISFGVYLGNEFTQYFGFVNNTITKVAHPYPLVITALILAALGFAVAFQARKADTLGLCLPLSSVMQFKVFHPAIWPNCWCFLCCLYCWSM